MIIHLHRSPLGNNYGRTMQADTRTTVRFGSKPHQGRRRYRYVADRRLRHMFFGEMLG